MNFSLIATSSVSCNKASASSLWHTRLGHPASTVVNRVLTSCNLPTKLSVGVCDTCQMAKSHRLPFSLSSFRALQPLNLVHSDLWGPAPEIGINGARYFVLFVDDHTRFSWLYLLQSKDEALSAFFQFKLMAENQFDHKLKVLQSDWDGEF